MLNRYARERNRAFLSLDKQKILDFCRKWHICVPDNETVFWCGVHKVIVHTQEATPMQKQKSLEWLESHGFSPEIYREERRNNAAD